MGEFVRVARVRDFRPGGRGRAVDLDGKQVAVFRTKDGWVAVSDPCPHMGASLADGKVVGQTVECSWHGWKFDTHTGRNAFKEWACVKVFRVRVEGDDVLLGRSEPEPPKPPKPPADSYFDD